MATLEQRLCARLERTASGCLEWRGYLSTNGYGQIGVGDGTKRIMSTHRAAYQIAYGAIPEGEVVRHSCDNRSCCNPLHLLAGTQRENIQDAVSRGRIARKNKLPHTKLTDAQVREVRERYDPKGGPTGRGGRRSNADDLAQEFGITRQYVMQLHRSEYRKDVA